jgi:hypothetical protein
MKGSGLAMTPADLFRELSYPLRNLTVVLAIVTFTFIFTITITIMQLGPVLTIVGAVLSLATLAAMIRYGMGVLEARANGQKPAVADTEMFALFDHLWAVFPLVLLFAASWMATVTQSALGSVAAIAFLIAFLAVLPASMAVLAITHSPLESLNPVAIGRMIGECGPAYVAIPLVLLVVFVASSLAADAGLPLIVDILLDVYTVFLLFTMTGAVASGSGVAARIDIGLPAGPTEQEVSETVRSDRQKVANHAYGIISRGNRDGGFRHIRQWIDEDPDPDGAIGWFFNEMMKWESKDAAMFFAQDCLAHYLYHDMDGKALKLLSACLHEDPRWRPSADDRGHAIDLAERHGREDLAKQLRG